MVLNHADTSPDTYQLVRLRMAAGRQDHAKQLLDALPEHGNLEGGLVGRLLSTGWSCKR